MNERQREAFIRSRRPKDKKEAEAYDKDQAMYDIVGEEYPGERFGEGGWGPLSDELKKFYD